MRLSHCFSHLEPSLVPPFSISIGIYIFVHLFIPFSPQVHSLFFLILPLTLLFLNPPLLPFLFHSRLSFSPFFFLITLDPFCLPTSLSVCRSIFFSLCLSISLLLSLFSLLSLTLSFLHPLPYPPSFFLSSPSFLPSPSPSFELSHSLSGMGIWNGNDVGRARGPGIFHHRADSILPFA